MIMSCAGHICRASHLHSAASIVFTNTNYQNNCISNQTKCNILSQNQCKLPKNITFCTLSPRASYPILSGMGTGPLRYGNRNGARMAADIKVVHGAQRLKQSHSQLTQWIDQSQHMEYMYSYNVYY